jgi:hypothetical protein
MENDFYITLPSNVQTYNYFPENTIANYKTKLASRVVLPGKWEVGLVEMSYTISWYNNFNAQSINLLFYENGLPKILENNVNLPPGRYDKIEDVIRAINDKMVLFKKLVPNYEQLPELSVDSKSRIITLKHGSKDNKLILLQMSKELCKMLGFSKEKMNKQYGEILINYAQTESTRNPTSNPAFKHDPPTRSQLIYKGQRPYEISAGFHSLFVYSDIVSPSFVGDSYTQLLRLIQIPSNVQFGEQILISYPNTYYVPVLSHEFETIEIDIKDDTGTNIPFEFGRSIVVLHFRKSL